MVVTLMLAFSLSQAGSAPAVAEANPFALNEPVKQFLDRNFDRGEDSLQRLQTLVHLVFEENELHFTYQPETRTAIETFSHHGGNCASFTFLFIAMARYLGLDARFREVDIVPIWSEVGDLTRMSEHADSVVYIGNQGYVVDLFPRVYGLQPGGRVVSDRRAVAHFWNNRGAEDLADGHAQEALACFRKALESDSGAAFVWANRGVAETVVGDYEEAVRCYRKALQLNDKDQVAMSNLASLYHRMGRLKEAARYQAAVRKFNLKNPYYHFRLGLQAYQAGEYKESVEEFRAALRLNSTDHQLYLALAKAYYKLGDLGKTEALIKQAQANAPDEAWKIRYQEKLRWLAAHMHHS